MKGRDADAPLLEREGPMREAGGLLADAQAGRGGALIVEGPAGIGKSALIRAIRERAEDEGFAVLAARGAELERDFSFGVVRQLFEPVLHAAAGAERDGLLAGAAQLAEPAVGELGAAPASEPSSASPSLDPSFSVLHGLFWLTANLAERSPLVLAVDDAHWADPASLRFLSYLGGRLGGLPDTVIKGEETFIDKEGRQDPCSGPWTTEEQSAITLLVKPLGNGSLTIWEIPHDFAREDPAPAGGLGGPPGDPVGRPRRAEAREAPLSWRAPSRSRPGRRWPRSGCGRRRR